MDLFTHDGINNTNSHTWAHQNPRNVTVHSYQHRHSVNVVTRQLSDWAILQGVSAKLPTPVLTGCTSRHTSPPVDAACSSSSHYQRGNSIDQWLPWSLDLSLLDFFVWGCMKSRVYLNAKPDTQEQLMQRINEAAVSIRNELVSMLCLVACVQAQCGHFEQYM
jgi:hypothetical protein